MIQEKEEAFYNRSLERALNILNVFDSEKQALTLAQLSATLNLPRATVLRLCSTLVKYSFLRQDTETKKYSLGIRLFELGSIVYGAFSLRRIASYHLAQLRTKLGTTIFLGVLDNDDLIYIDKREDPGNPVRFTSEIGRRRPPYWGMVGPMIMAYQSDSEIERLLEKRPFVPTAKKSFAGKEEFVAWLHEIRKQGFAIDQETAIDGISGVAAPVRDASGKVIAAIGVAFISSSLDSRGVKRMVKEATAAAHNISRELGYIDNKE
jgi:IclR family transcriptional regulator, KDG regulon repressor